MQRQERYDQKLDQILDHACRVFADKGFHNATVRDVAGSTGVSPAGLYYYFKSKDELLLLILEHTLKGLLASVREEAREARDLPQLLEAIVRAHLKHIGRNRSQMKVLVQEWGTLTGPADMEVRRLMRTYAGLVMRTLRRLSPERSSRELRAAAFGLFGMLTWVDQWYRPGKDLPMEDLAEEFTTLFLRGFLGGSEASADFLRDQAEDAGEGTGIRFGQRFAILSGPGF